MSKLDLDQLIVELRHLDRHHKLYRILRDELSKLGFWRVRPRGNPSKGFKVMKERKSKGDGK